MDLCRNCCGDHIFVLVILLIWADLRLRQETYDGNGTNVEQRWAALSHKNSDEMHRLCIRLPDDDLKVVIVGSGERRDVEMRGKHLILLEDEASDDIINFFDSASQVGRGIRATISPTVSWENKEAKRIAATEAGG